MRPIETTRQFERNLKVAKKRGKDVEKLWTVVNALARGERLGPRYRPHRLSGEWRDSWECHIDPDWLLIWRDAAHAVILVRLGTHSDLFG